jgi:L-rhamnose mutarotase
VKRYVLTLDLVEDKARVAKYVRHHRAIWPEVARSLRRVGIEAMDIYRLERRLVMVMDTRDGFHLRRSFAAHRASDPRCAEWEDLMRTFQRSPPGARPGQLWTPMTRVFALRRPARATSRR